MNILDPSVFANWATSPYAQAIMVALGVTESSFQLIPPEVVMLPLSFARPSWALWYALLTTLSSVAGAGLGYWIGQKGGKPLLKKFFSDDKVETVRVMFNRYDAWAIIIAAFTPIPFKVFTIASGVFDLKLSRMLLASLIGRGARYFLLGGLIYFFGEPIGNFIENQFDMFLLFSTVLLLGGVFVWKIAWPWLAKRYLKESLGEKVKRLFR